MVSQMPWPPQPAPQAETEPSLDDLLYELDREDGIIQVLVVLALCAALALSLLTLASQILG